jgi:O-antigen/teichoic acid export membrane protein
MVMREGMAMVEPRPEPVASIRSRAFQSFTHRGTHWLLVGSLLGGLGAYLFQVVGTRALGEEAYAPIGTLWTIQYLCWSTFLYAVETYVTREVVVGRVGRNFPRATAVRTLTWIGGFAAALTAGSWIIRDRLFYGLGDLAIVAGLTVLSFGAFAVVRGRLAGSGRFKAYGLVSASESLIRLALAVAVMMVAATTRALAWVLPVGAGAAACWWFFLRLRPPDVVVEPLQQVELPRTSRFLVLTTIANGAGQLLLAGGPLALVALSAPPAQLSVFFVTTTAARVPIVLALGGVLSRLLPTFTRVLTDRGKEALPGLAGRLAGGTALVAAIGTGAGAAIGPQLIGVFFGAGFTPPWWLAAAAGGGVLLATGGMLLNQLLVAAGLERRLPVPWFAGLAGGALVVVMTAASPMARVTAGFVVGEVVALVALVFAASLVGRMPVKEPSGL